MKEKRKYARLKLAKEREKQNKKEKVNLKRVRESTCLCLKQLLSLPFNLQRALHRPSLFCFA